MGRCNDDYDGMYIIIVPGYAGNGAMLSVPDATSSALGKSNSENDALYLHSAMERQLQVVEPSNR